MHLGKPHYSYPVREGSMAKSVIDQRTSSSDDEKLAIEFLAGRRTRENGRETHHYLSPGSYDELKAKAAFIRLLWNSDLPQSIRLSLSMLFNHIQSDAEPRELVFRYRSRGKRPDFVRDVGLAVDVAVKVERGMKLEAAIQEVMVVYGVKRATAFKAWKKHGKSSLSIPNANETKPTLIAGLGSPYPRV